MTCCQPKQPKDVQKIVVDLSQLNYSKPECPVDRGSCQLCQEILAVEKDIEDAVSNIEDLLIRHQRLKTQLNNTHSPIIRDLPVEILSMIFYSCFPDAMKNGDRLPSRCDPFVPLKVGAVCRTWRQIAWSSPEFWTIIVLDRVLSPVSYVCNQYFMIGEWIQRSGSLPVHVYLREDDSDSDNVGTVAKGCKCWEMSLELVSQCCDRWKDATMVLSRASFQYIASNFKLTPPTRSLTLQSRQFWPDEDDPLMLWQGSSTGPEEVVMCLPIMYGHINVGWKHVRRVDAYGWKTKDCLNLLKNAPQLRWCTFMDVMESVIDSSKPFCHNSLQSLFFEGAPASSQFLKHVTLPSLEELNYLPDYPPAAPPLPMDDPLLMPFINRSGCRLEKLSLAGRIVTHEYLVTILSAIPSLTLFHLQFSECSITRNDERNLLVSFMLHLATTATLSSSDSADDGNAFLPRLEVLEVGTNSFDFPWLSVPKMFGHPSELGKAGRRPLKNLTLYIWTPHCVTGLPADTIADLVRLQEAGAEILYHGVSDGSLVIPVTWK
ncbi:hypothetical protein CPC08DRAFT_296625 [Agrocybe pediades]|nr:hypothetical protein CPC08DRAFT_296625 [Agrocybe pediades]